MAYESVNPNDGKTVKTFHELTDAQLETKLATASIQAFVNKKLVRTHDMVAPHERSSAPPRTL